ncbi:hypothetical protein [Candidatus Uabimicrobium sp. HlEnr_7]|uniref:hypothetical protein n=1 Tax=Candidatus Uabimicrobium helgolandensis TaxID=3095367 RepID=UPI003557CF65
MKHLSMVIITTILLGCTSKPLHMKQTKLLTKLPVDKAIVCVHRPFAFARGNFEIWNGLKFVGYLPVKSILQVECEPGNQKFIAIGENKSIAFLQVEAGKVYHLVCESKQGWVNARVNIVAVDQDSKYQEKLAELLTKESPITISDDTLTPNNDDKNVVTSINHSQQILNNGFAENVYLEQIGEKPSFNQEIEMLIEVLSWVKPEIAANYKKRLRKIKTRGELEEIKKQIKKQIQDK